MLDLLSGLLLVFIFTELISTVRAAIARRAVQAEPFLVVGIVAAIRRLIVISAEAEDLLGTPRFRDLVLEIAVLAGGGAGARSDCAAAPHQPHERGGASPERDGLIASRGPLTLLLTATPVQRLLIQLGRMPQPSQARSRCSPPELGLLLLDALLGVAVLRGRWRKARALG